MEHRADDRAFITAVHEQWQRSRVYNRIPRVSTTSPPPRDYRVHITLVDMPAPDGTVQRLQVRYSPN